ncbi:MAG: GNAT family N-acetyltransferase [Sulfobacillus sp.]
MIAETRWRRISIGTIRLITANDANASRDGNFIRTLWVSPCCRRQGLGSALLRQMEEDIRTEGHGICYLVPGPLEPYASREEIRRFYRRRGYRSVVPWWAFWRKDCYLKNLAVPNFSNPRNFVQVGENVNDCDVERPCASFLQN